MKQARIIEGVTVIRELKALQDMKDFAQFISDYLLANNRENLALEVEKFSYNTYTTSSEYLGELRIVLKRILLETDMILSEEVKEYIAKAIEAINKAFDS